MTDSDTKRRERLQLVHALFASHVVGDSCQWYGTKEDENGHLLPCGEPAVGVGLFCDPNHMQCDMYDVCERHDRNKKAEPWGDDAAGWTVWG